MSPHGVRVNVSIPEEEMGAAQLCRGKSQVGSVPGSVTPSKRVENVSLQSCPAAAKLEPVGAALYQNFRRRYGLVRTTEERVAGFLGSILEHREASAILRLFARIVGAPAEGSRRGGG